MEHSCSGLLQMLLIKASKIIKPALDASGAYKQRMILPLFRFLCGVHMHTHTKARVCACTRGHSCANTTAHMHSLASTHIHTHACMYAAARIHARTHKHTHWHTHAAAAAHRQGNFVKQSTWKGCCSAAMNTFLKTCCQWSLAEALFLIVVANRRFIN
jgi:hypothetical protein